MSKELLSISDYPLAEKRPELVKGQRGRSVNEITLDALLQDRVGLEDLRITGGALRQQAEIASAAGRPTLAQNFERAAELAVIPQEVIMRTYELLRPGRARTKDELLAAAHDIRKTYQAVLIPAFIEEAAEIYERRGLFSRRY